MNIFAGNSLWHLVWQADFMSKIVLLILMSMSIMCWAIFLCKLALIVIKRKQIKKVIRDVKDVRTVKGIVEIANQHQNTAPGYFLSKNLVALKTMLQNSKNDFLDAQSWEYIQRYSDQTLDTVINHEESYVSFLSTSAAVAPLLGLFGTVWGLVHSFMRISEKQVADITTVAPGIAEALITTLAGLMVAMPALVMFNFLHNKIRVIEQQYIQLADSLTLIIYSLKERKDDSYAQTNTSAAAYEPTDRYFNDTAD